MKTDDIKAGASCYRRVTACSWEWALSFKLQSAVWSRCTLADSFACESSGSLSSCKQSFTSPLSAGLTGWLSCSVGLTSASPSSSSSSLTLWTMNRCLFRDSPDVKHRPQWRHWGVFAFILCCGICCWNCPLSSVIKPHFEQRNCVFRRFAKGAPKLEVRSCSSSCMSTAGLSDTTPCQTHKSHKWCQVGFWIF